MPRQVFRPEYSPLICVPVMSTAWPPSDSLQNLLDGGLVKPPTGMMILKPSVVPARLPLNVPLAVPEPPVQVIGPETV